MTTTSKAKPKDIQDIIHPLLSKAVLCRCGSSAQMLLHEGVCSQESKHWQKRANTEPCLLCYINFGGICLRCRWPCADMDRFLMICLAMAGNDHVLIPAGIQWFPSQGLLQSPLHVPAPPPTLLWPVCPTATVEQPHGLRNWSPPKIISSKNYQLLSPDWVIFHLSPFYLAMPLHELQTLILKVKVATPTS